MRLLAVVLNETAIPDNQAYAGVCTWARGTFTHLPARIGEQEGQHARPKHRQRRRKGPRHHHMLRLLRRPRLASSRLRHHFCSVCLTPPRIMRRRQLCVPGLGGGGQRRPAGDLLMQRLSQALRDPREGGNARKAQLMLLLPCLADRQLPVGLDLLHALGVLLHKGACVRKVLLYSRMLYIIYTPGGSVGRDVAGRVGQRQGACKRSSMWVGAPRAGHSASCRAARAALLQRMRRPACAALRKGSALRTGTARQAPAAPGALRRPLTCIGTGCSVGSTSSSCTASAASGGSGSPTFQSRSGRCSRTP